MTPHDNDTVATVPTLFSPIARAWKRDVAAVRAQHCVPESEDATIALWIVEAPWAHSFWHSYMVSLVHLRPMMKYGDPLLYDPNATHELLVYALNPAIPRQAAIDGKFPSLLTPCNFGAQLIGMTDAAAETLVDGAVGLIVSGELSPDTDAIHQWRALYGDNMIRADFR